MRNFLAVATLSFAFLAACQSNTQKLPIIGEREVIEKEVDGKTVVDTIYPAIPDFQFLNQDSVLISNKDFDNKIYVANFFFTHCPSICPTMQRNLLKAYQKYKTPRATAVLRAWASWALTRCMAVATRWRRNASLKEGRASPHAMATTAATAAVSTRLYPGASLRMGESFRSGASSMRFAARRRNRRGAAAAVGNLTGRTSSAPDARGGNGPPPILEGHSTGSGA